MANTKVQSEQIEDGAITAAKIADGAIVASEVADNAITTAKINADAVTGAKIADNAIDSEHYTDGSIDTVHIADAQVTTAKITDGNISTAKIADNAVTSAKIDTNIDIAGTFDVTGATTLDSTLAVAGLTTLSGDLTLASSTANKPVLTLTDTNADSQAPDLVFRKDSSSPADGDELFRIYGYGDDDAGNATEGFLMLATMTDVSNGSEDTKVRMMTYGAGSQRDTLTLAGLNVGIGVETPTDPQGFGTALHIEGGTNSVLYLRDTGNSNYGYLGFAGGSDNRTTLTSFGSGYLQFATNNTERMRINSAGLIGMGDSPNNLTSEIVTITTPASGGGQGIAFKRLDSNTDQSVGQIRWSNNSTDDLAFIKVKTDGANTSSAMQFFTNTGSASTERMRLQSDGKLLVTEIAHISGTSGNLEIGNGDEKHIMHSGGYHQFQVADTEIARINGEGIAFNGDSAAANSLDDYEEGLWSPTLSSDASATAYSIQNGFYTKIGRLVTVHATVKISTIGSFSGATVNIGGLPFTVGNLTNYDVAGTVIISDAASNISEPFLRFIDAQQYARIERFNGNEGTDRNLNANTIDTNTTIRVSGTYFSV